MSDKPRKDKPVVRTRTPRPDELSRESFEFITAIDDYKRNHMRSFLNDEEVLSVFYELGYRHPKSAIGPREEELVAFADVRLKYRKEHGRLFPTWSEIFDLLVGLGYQRSETDRADEHDTAA